MIPVTDKQVYADGESSSLLAGRLDLLLQRAINIEQFEADMVRACRQDPEEIWSLLALLDQYHRQGNLPTELFRALKASADRNGLVRREPYIPNQSAKARPAAASPPPPARAPASPPVPEPPVDAVEPDDTFEPADTFEDVSAAAAAAVAVREAAPPVVVVEPAVAPAAVEPPPRALGVGSVLGGRYRLEAELDSDDRGRNFQALDQQHAGQPAAVCQVAVHVAEPDSANFEAVLAERRTEFQLAHPLAHPNVLTVRELDQDGVHIYLTMNLMRGETLAALLARRLGKALARSAALAIIRDVGAALSYAHDHGVVHGNLQPQSILISPVGEVRVRDFGAQRAGSCYASGEQLEGRAPDRRDDLYALACISYELLKGSHPFDRHNASTARGRGMKPARPLRLDGAQWHALRQGLAWRREGRNLSVARWLGRMHLGSASKRVPALEALIEMPPPRRAWWRPVLLLVCLALAAGVASLYRSQDLPDLTASWNALRAMLPERLPSAVPASVPASAPEAQAPPPAATSAPPQETSPPPVETGPVQAPTVLAAPAPVPEAAPAPVPPTIAPAAQSAPQQPPVPAPREAAPTTPPPTAPAARRSEAAAKTPAATTTGAGAPTGPARLELSADRYTVQPGDSAARILVRRGGGARAEARFAWWTENGSASADLDFVAWGRRVERIPAGQDSVTLLVPIIKDATRSSPRTFYVLIGEEANGARLGGITRAAVLLPGTH